VIDRATPRRAARRDHLGARPVAIRRCRVAARRRFELRVLDPGPRRRTTAGLHPGGHAPRLLAAYLRRLSPTARRWPIPPRRRGPRRRARGSAPRLRLARRTAAAGVGRFTSTARRSCPTAI
jgi:hypothetical protein